jgi:hypothetical protein
MQRKNRRCDRFSGDMMRVLQRFLMATNELVAILRV